MSQKHIAPSILSSVLSLALSGSPLFAPQLSAQGEGPDEDRPGWPLWEEVPVADGEDTDGERYFSFGPYAFGFKIDSKVNKKGLWSRKLELFGEEDAPAIHAEAPRGSQWNFDRVWATQDLTVLLARGEGPQGPFLQLFRISPFEKLTELPLQPTPKQAWPLPDYPQAIDRERIYFFHGVPSALQSYFPPQLALMPGELTWRDLAWPTHEHLLREGLRPLLNEPLFEGAVAKNDRSTVETLRSLLKKPIRPIDPSAILGEWKVRSFQGSSFGHFVYPFFKARIVREPQGLFFEKTTGSQRRSGFLRPDRMDRLIFLGGRTVNDDPQRPYSGTPNREAKANGEPAESDSFGTFELLAPNHALMILDLTLDGAYEIYELKR